MAYCQDKKLFQLKELSQHQDISRKYLENIFSVLKKHHMVLSKVGKNGGFYLPHNLKKISLLNILEALEGKIDIVNCQNKNNPCLRVSFCPAKGIWDELNKSIKKTLAAKNLLDLSHEKDIRKK